MTMFSCAQLLTVLVLLILLSCPLLDGTLSKSDRNKKNAQNPKVVASASKAKQTSSSGQKLSTRADEVAGAGLTAQEILKNHHKLDYTADKKFPNMVLGYVTPWNNRGYDLAKWQAQKITHLSPVWLQILPDSDNPQPSCKIAGQHDIDRNWLDAVRSNNSEIKIVPRILFDKWMPVHFMRFLGDSLEQERCAHDIIDFLKRNNFQGAVIELWMSVMSMSQGQAAKDLVHFVINWGEIFRAEESLFILPVPPSLGPTLRENGMFTVNHFRAIAPYVDYINVMTYDYPDRKIGPIAPLDWVRKNVEYLLTAIPDYDKHLIIGINFYGREQRTQSTEMEAISGSRYIEVLKLKNPDIHWHKAAAEHFIQSGSHVAFYPSLPSIEARLNLAKELHVNVGIWDCGQGLDYFYNLF